MIKVAENLFLKEIKNSDCATLYSLMQEIYSSAYKHFWLDDGQWYVNTQYAKENILKELLVTNANYYFIVYKDEFVGNFRIIWDEKLSGLSQEKQVKLHRIYLHQKLQGKGIGKQLLLWFEAFSKSKNYTVIWLDAMDAQPQAFQFYKNLGYKYHSHTFLMFDNMLDEVKKMSQLYKEIK